MNATPTIFNDPKVNWHIPRPVTAEELDYVVARSMPGDNSLGWRLEGLTESSGVDSRFVELTALISSQSSQFPYDYILRISEAPRDFRAHHRTMLLGFTKTISYPFR